MWYLYLIQNNSSLETYIGITNNIDRRQAEHNNGLNRSTKRLEGEWRLVYFEAYVDKRDVVSRERKLKQYGKGRYELLKRCEKSLLKSRRRPFS